MTLASPPVAHIAVIGAGIAGLACAQALTDAGLAVTLFDKARGPGGRMSSRHRPDAVVDLGAQAFTARDPAFIAALDTWRHAGCAAGWPDSAWRAGPGGWQRIHDGRERFCGAPRMSAITRYLADQVEQAGAALHPATRIRAIDGAPGALRLQSEQGDIFGPYTQVVIAVPPPQAEPLVQPWDNVLGERCRHLAQRACWAGWAIFDAPLPTPQGVDANWQQAHAEHPALRLVSRNQRKPGRDRQPESVTLLAHSDWSEAHLEDAPAQVADVLLDALATLFSGQPLPALVEHGAHRWRYSQPADGGAFRPENGFIIGAAGLALCGDSLRGGRVEDAWLSGHRLGQRLGQGLTGCD
ncbi:FAD-dependent oxidoreductase [Halomonas cibimaris]|uniref:FAD-dependent oxidoreductase n=1 Tax=Halomonas cibimaris TaxID=657012 RepID=A0ABP7LWH5_9GAMM